MVVVYIYVYIYIWALWEIGSLLWLFVVIEYYNIPQRSFLIIIRVLHRISAAGLYDFGLGTELLDGIDEEAVTLKS